MYALALALVRLGNEVCVVDTNNDYQRNRDLGLHGMCLRRIWHPYINFKFLDHPSNAYLTHLVRQMTQISFSIWSLGDFLSSIQKNEFDVVNFHHRYPGGTLLLAKKLLRSKVPMVFSSHSNTWVTNMLSVRTRIFFFPESFCIRNATRVTAVSETLRLHMIRYVGAPKDKISVIYNGVDSEAFSPTQRSLDDSIEGDKRTILCISNIERRKNQLALIRAFPKVLENFPKAQLVFIGKRVEPAYFEQLIEACKTLAISNRVTFRGELPMFELPNHIRKADIIVCVTTREATIPRVLMEALSCEKATIASRIPEITEVLPEGVVMYVNPEDTAEISEAMIHLLLNRKLNYSLSKKAREFAIKRFDWISIARKYLEVYSDASV